MTLDDILARLREATEETQGDALREAVELAHDRGWTDIYAHRDAWEWLYSRAYESAALLLVPEGHGVDMRRYPGGVTDAYVYRRDHHHEPQSATGGMPLACAIAAAALQAHEARERSA